MPEAPAPGAPRRPDGIARVWVRSRPVVGLLVIALLGGTLFSAGAAVRRTQSSDGALCIATDLPVSGVDASVGKPVENAVNLAIQQNTDLGDGYTLKAINYDDVSAATGVHDPEQGARNMTNMARNPCVIGMVGPLNSNVAPLEMRIAANAGLVMISPANTNPGLTLRPYAAYAELPFDQMHPVGKKTNYFRDIPHDETQGVVDADFLAHDLGAHSVYIVIDPSPYADWLAAGLTREFLSLGGAITGTMRLPYDNPSVNVQVAATVATSRPDAVFFGGTVDGGAALLAYDLAQAGYTGPILGGDALAGDPAYLKQAGAAASNTFASQPGPDPSTFSTGAGARVLAAYRAKYPGQPATVYGAYAYDATMMLITAMRNLIHAGQPVTRAAMIDQIQNITYQGLSGTLSFDQNGDVSTGTYTFYQAQHGAWTVAGAITV